MGQYRASEQATCVVCLFSLIFGFAVAHVRVLLHTTMVTGSLFCCSSNEDGLLQASLASVVKLT